MDTLNFQRHLSRNSLFRMIVFAIAVAALVVWKLDYINAVYFRDQLTVTGWVINGAIITLFGLGVLKMITIFLGLLCIFRVHCVAHESICSKDFQRQLEKLRNIQHKRNEHFYNTFDRQQLIASKVTNMWDYVNVYEALESG